MRITDVTVQLVQSDDGRKWTHVRVFTDEGVWGSVRRRTATRSSSSRRWFGRSRIASSAGSVRDRADLSRPLRAWAGRVSHRRRHVHERHQRHRPGAVGPQGKAARRARECPRWAVHGRPRSRLHAFPWRHHGGADRGCPAPRRGGLQRREVEHGRVDRPRAPRQVATSCARSTRNTTRLRNALGDEIEIMDDPHAAYDAPSALEVARVLEPYRLLFLEEPTIPEDLEGYAHIHRGSSTTIAGLGTADEQVRVPRVLQGRRGRHRPARHRVHRRHHRDEEGGRDRRALPGGHRAAQHQGTGRNHGSRPRDGGHPERASSRSSSRPTYPVAQRRPQGSPGHQGQRTARPRSTRASASTSTRTRCNATSSADAVRRRQPSTAGSGRRVLDSRSRPIQVWPTRSANARCGYDVRGTPRGEHVVHGERPKDLPCSPKDVRARRDPASHPPELDEEPAERCETAVNTTLPDASRDRRVEAHVDALRLDAIAPRDRRGVLREDRP